MAPSADPEESDSSDLTELSGSDDDYEENRGAISRRHAPSEAGGNSSESSDEEVTDPSIRQSQKKNRKSHPNIFEVDGMLWLLLQI